MTLGHEPAQQSGVLTRRELRDRERAAARAMPVNAAVAYGGQSAAAVAETVDAHSELSSGPVAAEAAQFSSRRARRAAEHRADSAVVEHANAHAEGEAARMQAEPERPELAASARALRSGSAHAREESSETVPALPNAQDASECQEGPELSRRARRDAERSAAREAQLRETAAVAVECPKLPTAEAEGRSENPTVVAEELDTASAQVDVPVVGRIEAAATAAAIVSTVELDGPVAAGGDLAEARESTLEPAVVAPVISLDEARASRVAAGNSLPEAPENEPEVPRSFLQVPTASSGILALPFRRRHVGAGRFGGSLVALSLFAGTVVVGAGSAAAIGALSSVGDQQHGVGANGDGAQSLQVAGNVSEQSAQRSEDVSTITTIGTATAANLATGIRLQDPTTYTNNLAANVQWPFPVGVEFTDGYGPRPDGPAGTSDFHGGQDLTPGEGTPIGAIADGRVKNVELGGTSFGAFIEVEHIIDGQVVTSLYAHLQPSSIKVAVGDAVHVGDELAQVGNTGISTGPHLHLEVHIAGKYVNPVTFLKKLNVAGVSVSVPATVGTPVASADDQKLTDAESTAFIAATFPGF